jgi:hypothetical protein
LFGRCSAGADTVRGLDLAGIAWPTCSTDSQLPRFIKAASDAFLERAILAHGFLRQRFGEWSHDRLLAFSCTRSGCCPWCGARCMSHTAAHPVDQIVPQVPVRQSGLSLPIQLRPRTDPAWSEVRRALLGLFRGYPGVSATSIW